MKSHSSIKSMIVFAMLGALMFAAKIAFEVLPNIHPIAMNVKSYFSRSMISCGLIPLSSASA